MKTLGCARQVLCCCAFGSLLLVPAAGSAQANDSVPLMPLPAHLALGDGQFLIDGNFAVSIEDYPDARVAAARRRFLETLGRATGIPFAAEAAREGKHDASFLIRTAGPSEKVEALGEDESYHLSVAPGKVELAARNPLGIMHGLQTFLQLVHVTPQGFAAASVTIDDQPRFEWRGLMIDAGRHFMPVEMIERNLDGMEAVKLNVMHWHLSDDQGFRVESRQFPLLHEKGSNGSYYTQQQIKDVIEYAADRGIRVVPEFDMPCHTTALLTAYPQIGSGPGPYQIATKWGILDAALDPTREETYEFLDKFVGEMTALFPDAYFHIGGDECDGKEWKANAHIQEFMKAHGIKDNAALQSTFTGKIQAIVTRHHKIPVGWDEVLQPDTPKDVVVQSWRGPKGLAAAARQGNRVMLSNGYYIDLNQPASQHYLVDPLGGDATSLTSEQKTLVLGGEATMWSEFVTPENVDSRIWPRTAPIAERFWSPQDVRDVDSMYKRMAVVSQKLNDYGLEHNSSTQRMLQRMSGDADPKYLAILAAAVQPPLGYQRESLKEYSTASALNRLVDAVSPESETARQFAADCKDIAAGKGSPAEWKFVEEWLRAWSENDSKLGPSLAGSELTAELAPLSQSVSRVAGVGLKALDALKNHRAMLTDEKSSALAALKAAKKPQAVLVDKVAPSVEVLVDAAGK